MGVSAAPAPSPPPAAATSQWGHTHARIRTSLRGSRRPVPEFARLVTATAAVGSRATRSGFGLPDTRCTLGSRSTCALGEAPVERGHSASHATGGGGAQEGPEYERGVKGPGEEPQDWLPAAVSRRRRTPSPYLASSASSASGWISILH